MRIGRCVVAVLMGLVAAGCATTTAAPDAAGPDGRLYTPAGAGPFPAVVLMHGCGGVSPNVTAWAEWLRAEGYAALVHDSFTRRGLTRVCGEGSLLPARLRSDDAYVAAASLKRLPVVDGERIAVMGFSHGGASVLWAARSAGGERGVTLKAFVALYPGCSDLGGVLPGRGPVLMLLGGADDWAPAGPCQVTALRARALGRVVQEITYPDAHHGFDARHLRGPVRVADARRGQGATIAYHPGAHADAQKQIREFLARYLR